jgi:hypothetical protein
MILTKEEVEAYKKNASCFGVSTFRKICDALLEELAKPKVWDDAPDNAVIAEVCFYKSPILRGKEGLVEMKTYTRTLPKSHAREIAEKLYKELCKTHMTDETSISAIESTISKYKETEK